MTALAIFLTFLLLLAVLFAGGWGAFEFFRRLKFLESEARRLTLDGIDDSQKVERQFLELTNRLETAERRVADGLQRPLQSINYTQRSQVLRMIRRGDTDDLISNTLGIPLSHVRLLMKLPGLRPEAAGRPDALRRNGQAAGA
jgi:hypothetical protein